MSIQEIISEDMLGDYDMTKLGDQNITVSEGDQQVTFKINVKEIPATKVILSSTLLNINKGDTHQLTADVIPADTTNKAIVWESSNPDVATVTETGSVYAKAKGTTTITATAASGASVQCAITVHIPCVKLLLNTYTKDMYIGDQTTLKATLSPLDSDSTLSWESSDSRIASVSDGEILACGVGSATITVQTDNDIQATCKINVKQKLDSFPFFVCRIQVGRTKIIRNIHNSAIVYKN